MNEQEQNNTPVTGSGAENSKVYPPQDSPLRQAPPRSSAETSGEEHKSVGQIVGIVVIILVLLAGGLYFWGTRLNKEAVDSEVGPAGKTAEDIAASPDTATEALGAQSTSDAVADIEADLGATELDSLDQELENIDIEFNF